MGPNGQAYPRFPWDKLSRIFTRPLKTLGEKYFQASRKRPETFFTEAEIERSEPPAAVAEASFPWFSSRKRVRRGTARRAVSRRVSAAPSQRLSPLPPRRILADALSGLLVVRDAKAPCGRHENLPASRRVHENASRNSRTRHWRVREGTSSETGTLRRASSSDVR